ncbi:MAG TPA: efflux RND transporter periplasmic adaptor subunit [Beijerinckiaceae bacterium]|nr:efflux RND transporter periplasmic adaptor subunit [Beijerinckiaceae bacterium]
MKRAKALGKLVVLFAVLFAAAVAWPAYIDRYFPGWGERAIAVRAHLPASIAKALPKYPNEESKSANRQPAATSNAGPASITVARPPVPVVVETVQRGPIPVRIEAVGTVQPIASVAIKTRVDAEIEDIRVPDGAAVKAGDVLVDLDARQIDAQIQQTEAALAKDQTVLDQTTRDVARFSTLVAKGADTQLNLDNSKTAQAAAKAQIANDEAQIVNQKVQRSWYTIASPINGRVGTFSAKPGNILRASDNTVTGTLATIVQTQPIYVAFSVPQGWIPELRDAIKADGAQTVSTPQGASKSSSGQVSVLDNMVDVTTGTVMVRATFPNQDEALWPGQLCNVTVTLRTDPDTVSVPREATQSGQIGNYVFVVENGIAHLRQVKVGRYQDGRDIVIDGLKGGETVVTDGALQLVEGARVDIQKDNSKKGAT